MRIQRFRRTSAGMLVFAQSSTSSYSRDPMPRSAAPMVWIPLRLLTLSMKWSRPGSSDPMTRSMQAWSMATGSSEDSMPMSCTQGFSGCMTQSQSTDRFVAGEITDTECGIEIKCLMTGEDPEKAAEASGDLDKIVSDCLDQNPGIVDDYRKNEKAANKAIGFVMKSSGGRYSSSEVVDAVKRMIESRL